MPKKQSEQGFIIDYCYTHPLPEVESLRAIIDDAIRARRRREGKPERAPRKPREKKPEAAPPVQVLNAGCQLSTHALCTHAGGGRATA